MQAQPMDLAGFGRVVETHYPAVAAVAFAVTRDLALAEDVAQDTFVTAWTSLATLREVDRIRPWLCGIARNRAKNALRDRRRKLGTDEEVLDMRPSIIDHAIDRETVRSLERSLAAIPSAYREPLVLFYWHEQSIEEVAATLELSPQAAQKRISRARRFLKDELQAQLDDTGHACKRAAPAVAAAVLAAIATRTTAATAASASTTKGSLMLSKVIALTAAGTAMIAGVALWTQRHTDAAATTSNAGPTASALQARPPVAVPVSPALPSRIAPGSGYQPGAPARAASFGSTGAYELTVLSPIDVGVELGGGRSGVYVFQQPPPPTTSRHVHGRVLDEHGAGIAGAVVVAASELRVQFGSLLGECGAVSATDGTFDLVAHDTRPLYVIALHSRGWSAVTAATDTSDVELAIGAPGTLALHFRQGGDARDADVQVTQPGMHFYMATDAHGELALSRLAPGTYHVQAEPLQGFAGGTAKPVERDVALRSNTTSDVTLEFNTGTLLAVTATHAQELSMIEYFLVPGRTQPTLAELNQRPRAVGVLGTLFGGQDLDRPMQFHDLAAGAYTLCIDQVTPAREHLPLDCRTVEIRGDAPVVDLEVKLP